MWVRPTRWTLSRLAAVYGRAIARRNRQFDNGTRKIVRLAVPVISVGNITTGGTGKTPLAIELCKLLAGRGRTPAVVARGYKSRRGEPADELTTVSERVPEAVCVANPDRAAGGRAAIERGADVIVLDDGFQHRRVARDLDIVLVDATDPLRSGHLLPLGRLREPVEQLARADLIVISRADLAGDGEIARLQELVARMAPKAHCVTCRHRPVGVLDLCGSSCTSHYERAFLFGGIGNPEAFVRTVKGMGIDPVGWRWWPDHHRYTHRDLLKLAESALAVEHDVVLTTEKDAVKLRGVDVPGLGPLRVVAIDIEFLDGGEQVVASCLDAVLTS